MEIVRIFDKNLYAFKLEGEQQDEFHRLFSLWNDPEYLEGFFEANKADITNGFYGTFSVEGAIVETYDIAEYLEMQIHDLATQGQRFQLKGLNSIFKPLYDSQTRILPFNKSKVRQDWLRLYALRIEKDVYIITGGAIKLTRTMQERDHTRIELDKMERCRNYLIDLGVPDAEGLFEEMEI